MTQGQQHAMDSWCDSYQWEGHNHLLIMTIHKRFSKNTCIQSCDILFTMMILILNVIFTMYVQYWTS